MIKELTLEIAELFLKDSDSIDLLEFTKFSDAGAGFWKAQ